jgi:Zn ribbon nucleic-acid-binding protein
MHQKRRNFRGGPELPRRPDFNSEGRRPVEIMGFKCPSCRSCDWLYVGRGERHYVRCIECGQVRLLLVRSLPPTKAKSILTGLFPPAATD